MSLTVGSLFSGIGGLELGLERAGMVVKWQVEQDAYCRAVLAKHWPNVKRYEDVRDVGRHNLEPVDLICGGFPCQDISSAGRKTGIGGPKSALWLEFARVIRECRPRIVLIENTAALRARGLRDVLLELAAIGYDARWGGISSCSVGATHARRRLFVVAHPHGTGEPVSPLDAEAPRLRPYAVRLRNERRPLPRTLRMAHGLPHGMDRLRALGNAVDPRVAEWIGKRIVEAHEEMTPPSTREKTS